MRAISRIAATLRAKLHRDGMPDQVILDVSWACNIDCTCCVLKTHNPCPGFMSLEMVERLSDVIPHLRGVGLSCCGEPLLNRELIEIIAYIRQLNPAVGISMSTNGTLLTESIASGLVKNRVNVVCVSVDGATAGTFEALRKGADFEAVISNVKGLIAQRESQGFPLEARFVSVIHKDNIHELPAIVDLAASLGVNGVFVNGVEPYSEEMSHKVLYGEAVNPEYEKLFSEARSRAATHGIYLELPSLSIVPYRSCFLTGTPIINWKGEVFPCALFAYERPFYYRAEKAVHPRVCLGNINRHSLVRIWNSRKYRRFRTDALRGRLAGDCRKCLVMSRVVCKLPESA